MIESIRRKDATILLEINTGLCIKEPIVWFSFNAGTEIEAELLRKHLYDLQNQAKKKIATECMLYLGREEKSQLKSKLKKWNGAKHCWK